MRAFGQFNRVMGLFRNGLVRFKFPFSLPEEIGLDLGLDVTNNTDFDTLLKFLSGPSCHPRNLQKYMKKVDAEPLFSNAFRSDYFKHKSIHCYYFKQGWVEFELVYDNSDRLRRIIMQSRDIHADEGVEIKLHSPNK